jgi:trimethylamine--corrinoid protein Co-methyltransferase
MRAQMTLLGGEEIEKIHRTTLQVMEKVGIKVTSAKVRDLLAAKGAKVEGELVRFPAAMVEDYIKLVKKEFVLAARDANKSLPLPAMEFPYSSTAGYGAFVIDVKTGQKRKSTAQDLREFCIVCDYLDCVDYYWPIVMPTDGPPDLEEYAALDIALRNITKHIQTTSSEEKNSQWHVRLAALVAGGEDALRQNPLFSAVASPNTPLAIEKGVGESIVVLAKAGIPIAPMNVPQGGTTAPITMAGTMVVGNAEELTCLLIAKAANPEAPMIYASDMGAANIRTGNLDYDGVEYPLFGAGAAQLSRYYQMPSLVAHGSCEVPPWDLVSLERNVYRTMVSLMTRTDGSAWMGGFESSLGGTMTGLILDAEVLEHVKGYIRRHDVDETTLAFDVIAEVGPHGNFLTCQHTVDHIRGELWTLRPEDSIVLEGGLSGDFKQKAKEKAEKILATHRPTPIAPDIEREMDQLMVAARKDILGE